MSRPMLTLTTILTTLVLGAAAVAPAHAAEPTERREAMREKLKDMTPEQKAEMREKAKARWDAMTPEQQAAAKKRMAERHPKLKDRQSDQAKPAAD